MDALEDVQATLDVLVAHLGLASEVQLAVAGRRAKAEASRDEIERSLGRVDFDGDGRR
jgi:hypothetical protein